MSLNPSTPNPSPETPKHQTPTLLRLQEDLAHIKSADLGPYSRAMPRALWWSWGGGLFLMREKPRAGHHQPHHQPQSIHPRMHAAAVNSQPYTVNPRPKTTINPEPQWETYPTIDGRYDDKTVKLCDFALKAHSFNPKIIDRLMEGRAELLHPQRRHGETGFTPT